MLDSPEEKKMSALFAVSAVACPGVSVTPGSLPQAQLPHSRNVIRAKEISALSAFSAVAFRRGPHDDGVLRQRGDELADARHLLHAFDCRERARDSFRTHRQLRAVGEF